MANRRAKRLEWVPVQLPLFPEHASLARIRPETNEWRFYRLEVWPDLFGRALLIRQWGRIGTEGRRRLDPHSDPGSALNALAAIASLKRRRRLRGQVDRTRRCRQSDFKWNKLRCFSSEGCGVVPFSRRFTSSRWVMQPHRV
jgi:predicted DNA-binding WGR domain protein